MRTDNGRLLAGGLSCGKQFVSSRCLSIDRLLSTNLQDKHWSWACGCACVRWGFLGILGAVGGHRFCLGWGRGF